MLARFCRTPCTCRDHNLTVSTLASDCVYDEGDFLRALEAESVRPHIAIRDGVIFEEDAGGDARRRARAMRESHGYEVSQRRRKIVEEFFGWAKTIAGLRRTTYVKRRKIRQQAEMTAAAYNLVRMRRLLAA